MLSNLNGWHLLIVILVVLLIFGAPKLPGLARSLGQSMRIFRQEVKAMKDDDSDAPSSEKSESVKSTPRSSSTAATKSTSAKAGKSTSK
jgi:sec-independent protein translocase protein TatA